MLNKILDTYPILDIGLGYVLKLRPAIGERAEAFS